MNGATDPPAAGPAPGAPRPGSRRLWFAGAVLALLAVAAAVAVWQWPRPAPPPAAPRDGDPRLTYPTPYRNVRPEVRYVGDEACAECHAEQAQTYRRHPMGRSLTPVGRFAVAQLDEDQRLHLLAPGPLGSLLGRAVRQAVDRVTHNPFEHYANEFRVEVQGGRVFHAEARRDGRGRVVGEGRQEVLYEVGAGVHGYSYLIQRDGCLYQSPISWFTQTGRWDLSPGFGPDFHFDRPIGPECLFCHSNFADHVEHTVNCYRQPAFRGHAIGCERCHGPGELHVAARERGEGRGGLDATIVNPRRLDPPLREAVCEQCHLEGEVRVIRRGRKEFDFRPGLPLELFEAVFVTPPRPGRPSRAVSHVEQMHLSRCFTGSGGRMGCSTCHDPHALPAAEERLDYYRRRCARCHEEGRNGCSLSLASRRRNGDDCLACHMPRIGNSDVAHSAASDHRIPRRPDGGGELAARPPELAGAADLPVVAFHPEAPGAGGEGVGRDLGLALVALARKQPRAARPLSTRALPLLDSAVTIRPDDVPCWEGEVFALMVLGRPEEAVQAGETVLALAPEREQTLAWMAHLAEGQGRLTQALDYCRRALALAPSSARYRLEEASLLAKLQHWDGAVESARQAVLLNPCGPDGHVLLGIGYLHTGRQHAARAELDTALVLDPGRGDEFRALFAGLPP